MSAENIVDRLGQLADYQDSRQCYGTAETMRNAAAEIVRLRGEVAKWRGLTDAALLSAEVSQRRDERMARIAPAEAKGDEFRYPPFLTHDEDGDPIYSFPLGPYRVSVVGDGNKLSVLATEGSKIAYVGEHVEWTPQPADGGAVAAHPSACELGAVLAGLQSRWAKSGTEESRRDRWWAGYDAGRRGCAIDLQAAIQHRGDSRGGEGS